MSLNRFVIAFVLLSLCAPLCVAQPIAQAIRPDNNVLAARGFQELYNADYDLAIRDLSKLQIEHPDDPFTSNYLVAALIFKELNRIGALDTEAYSTDGFLASSGSKVRKPLDPEAQKRIFDLVAHVESLCDARLQKNPNDVDALYARGVARGFRSTYMGMAQKSWMPAIRSALASRRDHERVLELNPNYVDAKMTVGIHNYIIGSLNWAGRAAVALVGVTGNKQKGLNYLREVSRSHGTSSNDGAMALALFLRREQRYPEALELVSRVSHQYPRNFLIALEYAHLLNAAGHGHEAIEQYRLIFDKGRAGKYSTFQPELVAWGLGVSLRGQRQFDQAAVAFDQISSVPGADTALVDRATLSAGEMYDTLGRRNEAVARYRKVTDAGRDGDTASLARRHLRHPYVFTEQPAR
jgi:tetratricopeptide (TPR) repeat protein